MYFYIPKKSETVYLILKITIMKKGLLLLIAGIASVTFSCKKDSTTPDKTTTDTTKVTVNPTPTVTPTEDLAKTTAENKATMETEGVNCINELRSIKSTTGIKALINLSNLGNSSSTKSYVVNSKLPISILLKSLMAGSTTGALKALKADVPEVNFKSEISKIACTMTWNNATNEWDSSAAESANVVKILFPARDGDITNTAELKLYNMGFTTVATTNSYYSANNAITSCSAYLKIDGTSAMNYSLSVVYDTKGLPSSITTSLGIDAFSLNYDLAYSSSKITSALTVKNNTTTLLAQGFEVNGTMTDAKAKELQNLYDTSETGMSKIGEFVKTGIIYYQVMDMKIVGSIDVENFTKAFDALSSTDKQNFTDNDCATINKYCQLYGIFASTQKKFADATVYAKTVNGSTSTSPAILLTFPDASKVDAETYFSDAANFANFKSELDKFIAEVK